MSLVIENNSRWWSKKGFNSQIIGNQKFPITIQVATKNGFQSPYKWQLKMGFSCHSKNLIIGWQLKSIVVTKS